MITARVRLALFEKNMDYWNLELAVVATGQIFDRFLGEAS